MAETKTHPFRVVRIEGVTARLFARAPAEFTSVKDAEVADRALSDPGNTHFCPLCTQFYGTVAFKSHIRNCVDVHAPAWERQRDVEPPYKRRYGSRLIVPGYDPREGTE